MIPTLVQTTGGCPQGCGGGVGAITCVSRQGNGYLRGWTKFANVNSGDWNLRKYTRRHISGSGTSCCGDSYGDSYGSCSDSLGCANSSPVEMRRAYLTVSGYRLWNTGTNAPNNSNVSLSGWYWNRGAHGTGTMCSNVPSCGSTTPPTTYSSNPGWWIVPEIRRPAESGNTECVADCAHVVPLDDSEQSDVGDFVRSCARSITETETSRETSSPGCGTFASSCVATQTSVRVSGDFSDWMDTPDTTTDALERNSPTYGTQCRTTAGTIGSSPAGSTSEIDITGVRAVRATIPLSGLSVGVDYIVTVNLSRYTAGGGGFVDTITDEVTFTAAAASEDMEYDVPVNTDYDYEITGASFAPA